MGRFKSKKKFNNTIIYIGLFIISIGFSIKYIYQRNLINDNTIIDTLIGNKDNYSTNIMDVDFLLKYVLNVELKKDNLVFNSENVINEKVEIVDNEIKSKPLVYIYNTHQEEKYKNEYLKDYNISSTVFIASKILKEYLEDLGIGVIVEEQNVTNKLHSLGWKYGSSYKVSRMFMEEAFKKNQTLTYFIDLHRDSSKYEYTTTEINDEKYAKLLFVIGLDNSNYNLNLELAEKLKEKIISYDKSLFRGIMKKSGAGVNGVYNQDFNENSILIEVGGQYNNISEVNNTLKVLANILKDYIEEDINEKEKE